MGTSTNVLREHAGGQEARAAERVHPDVAGRDVAVDILRGLAIVLVVFGHANRGAIDSHLPSAVDLRAVDFVIYTVHMPLFFYLGGYYAQWTRERQGQPEYLRSRLTKIVWPYLLWSVIYFAVGWLMSAVTTINDPISAQELAAIGWQPFGTLWFLYALLIMQLVASLAPERGSVLLLASLAISALVGLVAELGTNSIVERIVCHSPFFFAGLVVAGRGKQPLFWPAYTAPFVAGLLAVFAAAGAGLYLLGVRVPVQFSTLPLTILGMVALGELARTARVGQGMASLLRALGQASLGIYLLHTLVLALVPRLLRMAHADTASLRLIVGTFIGVAGSYAIYVVLNRLKLATFLGLR